MNDLVLIQNDRAVADSRAVAERFGKRHRDVLRSIDKLLEDAPECARNFALTSYAVPGPRGGFRDERFFQMDRDGFSLLVMRFTGAEALRWQIAYIAAFNRMEEQLRGPALTYERQKDMVLTIREAFGEDDARRTALSYGWPIRKRPRALSAPKESPQDTILNRLAAVTAELANRSPHGFTPDELCRAAEVLPSAVTPGMWDLYAMYARGIRLQQGSTHVGGRIVQVWRIGAI